MSAERPAQPNLVGTRMAFPLPAKIFALFALNLALIVAGAVYVARGQFGFGLDSLLTGSSGERVQNMAMLAVAELRASPRAVWPEILKNIANASRVQIAAIRNDGVKIAGAIPEPPREVLAKLAAGTLDPRRAQQPDFRRPLREETDFRGPPEDGMRPPREGTFPQGPQQGDPRRRRPSGDGGGFPPPRDGAGAGPQQRPPIFRDGIDPFRPQTQQPPPGDAGARPPTDDGAENADSADAADNGSVPPPPISAPTPPTAAAAREFTPGVAPEIAPDIGPQRRSDFSPRPPRPGNLQPRPDSPQFPSPAPNAPSPRLSPNGGANGFPKFIVRAGEPPQYWIGVRAPLPEDDGRFGAPSSLLIVVPTLGAGGLLLDVTPWLWIGAAALAGSVLLWLPFVRGITRSVRQMTGAAGQMAQGEFGTRVDTQRRDEIGRLGESLNHMAGRLGEYVTGQKRFLGDIAHELCSPLARMEMALGILDQRADAAQCDYVNDVREEVRHMSSLVNELLSFSKAGLRAKDIELKPVALADICTSVIARDAAGKPDIVIEIAASVSVLAGADLLARAISNVLRNAVRYAGDAGPITFAVSTRGETVALTITDSGPGVPPEALHRLFDPFYRPETARTREGGGAGLGLAIVKSCIEACGGSVAVKNAQPRGLEVTMTLKRG